MAAAGGLIQTSLGRGWGLVMNSLLDTGRLRETLDFTPRYSVEEGIELYIEDVKRRESV